MNFTKLVDTPAATAQSIVASPDVRCNISEDGGLLLNIKTGKYYSLNPIGAIAWEGIIGGCSIDDIVSKLHDRYRLPREQIRVDLTAFMQKLERTGAIQDAEPTRG